MSTFKGIHEFSEAEQFFYDHAGVGYRPDEETEQEGRIRGAIQLALAEARLKAGPYFIDVVPDDGPWDGDVPYDGPLWNVDLYSVSGSIESTLIGSIGGVATESAEGPYIRVVSAELALEYITGDQA